LIEVTLQESELKLVALVDGTVILRVLGDNHVFNIPISAADCERLANELKVGEHRLVA
jgi:hypothetical protein